MFSRTSSILSNLKPSRIFYGWWIVAACFGFAIYSAGVVVYGFTAFFDPIIQEFGWSYAQISLAASLRGAESGLIAPVLGFFVDRWGARWVLFAGSLVTGLGLIFLSMIDTLTGFYIAFFIIAVGISCCGPSVITPAASNWFRRNLGMAIGILSAGFAFGGTLVPLIIWMIDTFQWRLTLLILGIAGLLVCLPLSMVIRDRPEKYGCAPDGVPLPEKSRADTRSEPVSLSSTPPPAETNVGVKPALKSRTFWHLSLAFTLQYVVIGGILTHIMPYLESVDVPRSTASFFAAAIPIVSIVGRLSSGWLSDKFNRKNVTAAYFGVICIGTLLFDYVSGLTIWVLILAVILYGLSYGSANTMRAVLLREYFGRSRFATIFGFLTGILSLGTILGPFLAGWVFDTFASYHYAWWIFTVINILALLLLVSTPKMKPASTVSSLT